MYVPTEYSFERNCWLGSMGELDIVFGRFHHHDWKSGGGPLEGMESLKRTVQSIHNYMHYQEFSNHDCITSLVSKLTR